MGYEQPPGGLVLLNPRLQRLVWGPRDDGRSLALWRISGLAGAGRAINNCISHCTLNTGGQSVLQGSNRRVSVLGLKLELHVSEPSQCFRAPRAADVEDDGDQGWPWVALVFEAFMPRKAYGGGEVRVGAPCNNGHVEISSSASWVVVGDVEDCTGVCCVPGWDGLFFLRV